jgi:4-aminobutyrate aminotransferase
VIGDVRGTGFMVGVKFINPKTKKPNPEYMEELEYLAFSKGLLLLGCGISTIRLSPPLIVGIHEIEVMLCILEECIVELNAKYSY